VAAAAAAWWCASFPICLQCLWLLILHVLTQCSCVGLLR
jgi:hypothetical protein